MISLDKLAQDCLTSFHRGCWSTGTAPQGGCGLSFSGHSGSCATCSRWPWLGRGVGLDDPQRCNHYWLVTPIPISTSKQIPWFRTTQAQIWPLTFCSFVVQSVSQFSLFQSVSRQCSDSHMPFLGQSVPGDVCVMLYKNPGLLHRRPHLPSGQLDILPQWILSTIKTYWPLWP